MREMALMKEETIPALKRQVDTIPALKRQVTNLESKVATLEGLTDIFLDSVCPAVARAQIEQFNGVFSGATGCPLPKKGESYAQFYAFAKLVLPAKWGWLLDMMSKLYHDCSEVLHSDPSPELVEATQPAATQPGAGAQLARRALPKGLQAPPKGRNEIPHLETLIEWVRPSTLYYGLPGEERWVDFEYEFVTEGGVTYLRCTNGFRTNSFRLRNHMAEQQALQEAAAAPREEPLRKRAKGEPSAYE